MKTICKRYATIFLFFSFPTLATGIFSFVVNLKWFPIAEMLRGLIVDFLIFTPAIILPSFLSIFYILALFPALLVITLTSSLHTILYKSPPSKFAIQSILETSHNESIEFLHEFTTPSTCLLATTLLIAYFFIIKKSSNYIKTTDKNYKINILILIIASLITFSAYQKGNKLLLSNISYLTAYSVSQYNHDIHILNDIRKTRNSINFNNIQVYKSSQSRQKNYIFIIGESASKHHMSIYGYGRQTTPKLEQLSQECIVFSDVVSADTHTIPALRKSLLFHEGTDEHDILKAPSIIGLLRNAGFKTFWLSNQTANSDGLTGTSILAGDAHYQAFLNKSRHEGQSSSYDEVLLPELKKALADPAPNKAIFLHLIGSHLSYSLRYPRAFAKFHERCDASSEAWRIAASDYINAYDNSIYYTDSLIGDVIKSVDAVEGENFVLYFSDHGQEVYDTRDMRGQDAKNPSRNMIEIPLVCWISPEYRAANSDMVSRMEQAKDRPFSMAWFAQTAADLARVSFDGAHPELSLFADDYIARERPLPNGRTYEEMFGKKTIQ